MLECSIIVNCWNADLTIKRAVVSLLNQTITDLEIIIYDNASSDQTASVAESLSKIDKRVLVFKAHEHVPLSIARNKAIGYASKKWIAFCDADDWWMPDKLESQLSDLKSSGKKWCCSDFFVINFKDQVIESKYRGRKSGNVSAWSQALSYRVGMLTLVCESTLLKQTIQEVNSRAEFIWDLEVCSRLAEICEGRYLSAPLAYNNVALQCLSVCRQADLKNEALRWYLNKFNGSNSKLFRALYAQNIIRLNVFDAKHNSLSIFIYGFFGLSFYFLFKIYLRFQSFRSWVLNFSGKLYSKIKTIFIYRYFVNFPLAVPSPFALNLPDGMSVKVTESDHLALDSPETIFLLNSNIFDLKEFERHSNFVVFSLEDSNSRIVHATIVHLDFLKSPLMKTRFPFKKFSALKAAYLSTGYTLVSFRRCPATLICLNYIFSYLRRNRYDCAFNVVDRSTANGVSYFKALGFQNVFEC